MLNKHSMKETEKIEWLRFLLAITAACGLTAFYVQLNGKEIGSNFIDLALQIIPELLGALIILVIVYFLFIKQGISSEESLKNQLVKALVKELNEDGYGSQTEIDIKFNIKDKLSKAKEVKILAYSCRYLIAGLKTEIVEALLNGASIKIIIVEPNSIASKLAMENSFQDIEFDITDTTKRVKSIIEEVSQTPKKIKKGKIEQKFINWIPSCSLIIWIPNNNTSKECKLKINPIDHDTPLAKIMTHAIIKEDNDKDTFDYLESQFDKLWIKAHT